MMRDSEVELVRECFRWLYNDEDDDLKTPRPRRDVCRPDHHVSAAAPG